MSCLRILAGSVALSLLTGLIICGPGWASQETEYAEAVRLYRLGHFKEAGDMFWKSITDGNMEAKPWLYSANCFYAQGRFDEALERFQKTSTIFKGTPEAAAAAEYAKVTVNKIKAQGTQQATNIAASAAATAAAAAPAAANISKPATASSATANSKFSSRIEIVRPAMGHPAVSQQMMATINRAISKIPAYLMQALDQGGGSTHLTCSLVDKWPDCLTTKHTFDNQTMSTDRGHTYGHEIWVCERPVNAETNLAEDAFPQADIEATFFNEVGHSLDDLMGNFSKNMDFRKAYGADVQALSNAPSVGFFLQAGDAGPSETCAEIVSDLLGAHGSQTVDMKASFPRSFAWVKQRLRL